MKTIIAHFYNEEYLLPFWLKHHKKYFDYGILVDYNSTDNSVSIINEICPNWKVVQSKNDTFNASKCDLEIMEIEKGVHGFRICLNITEFLIGNYQILEQHENTDTVFLIPSYVMVDDKNQMYTEVNENLVLERTNGVDLKKGNNFGIRRARCLSNFNVNYPLGRHFEQYNTDEFRILWYGAYSPFNDKTIKRKLQIQTKIPESDKLQKLGYQHIITETELISNFEYYQTQSENLYEEIKHLI